MAAQTGGGLVSKRTAFHNPPFIEHNTVIRVLYRLNSVGDGDDSALFQPFSEDLLDVERSFDVDGRRGLSNRC